MQGQSIKASLLPHHSLGLFRDDDILFKQKHLKNQTHYVFKEISSFTLRLLRHHPKGILGKLKLLVTALWFHKQAIRHVCISARCPGLLQAAESAQVCWGWQKVPPLWPSSASEEAFQEGGRREGGGKRGRVDPWWGSRGRGEELGSRPDANPCPWAMQPQSRPLRAGQICDCYFTGSGLRSPIRLLGAYHEVMGQTVLCPAMSSSCFLPWLGCSAGELVCLLLPMLDWAGSLTKTTAPECSVSSNVHRILPPERSSPVISIKREVSCMQRRTTLAETGELILVYRNDINKSIL